VQLSKKHRLVAVQPTGAFDFLEQAIETNDFEIAASDRLFARGLFFINETISRAFNVLTFYNDRYISTQTRE
jgi:hypothetical protein